MLLQIANLRKKAMENTTNGLLSKVRMYSIPFYFQILRFSGQLNICCLKITSTTIGTKFKNIKKIKQLDVSVCIKITWISIWVEHSRVGQKTSNNQTNKQTNKISWTKGPSKFYSIVLFYLMQYWKFTIQHSRQFNSFYFYKRNSKNQTDQTQPLHGWNIADTA